MTTDNEQTTGMGVAQRFVKAAEELHLSGGRLYRDGIEGLKMKDCSTTQILNYV